MSVSAASSADKTPEYDPDDDDTSTTRSHPARGHIVRQGLKLAPPSATRARGVDNSVHCEPRHDCPPATKLEVHRGTAASRTAAEVRALRQEVQELRASRQVPPAMAPVSSLLSSSPSLTQLSAEADAAVSVATLAAAVPANGA